jgi:hypothetical protein
MLCLAALILNSSLPVFINCGISLYILIIYFIRWESYLQRRCMRSFVASFGMTNAGATGHNHNTWELSPTIFAGVDALFAAFV